MQNNEQTTGKNCSINSFHGDCHALGFFLQTQTWVDKDLVRQNKQYHSYELFKLTSFCLNGNTLVFHTQTKKLDRRSQVTGLRFDSRGFFLPFFILQLVKTLPFYIPPACKRHPFRAEPPRIVHYRECPPPVWPSCCLDCSVWFQIEINSTPFFYWTI